MTGGQECDSPQARERWKPLGLWASPGGVALALEGLAGAAGLSGNYEMSARLLGASESVRRAASAPSAPPEQAEIDRIIAAPRAALG